MNICAFLCKVTGWQLRTWLTCTIKNMWYLCCCQMYRLCCLIFFLCFVLCPAVLYLSDQILRPFFVFVQLSSCYYCISMLNTWWMQYYVGLEVTGHFNREKNTEYNKGFKESFCCCCFCSCHHAASVTRDWTYQSRHSQVTKCCYVTALSTKTLIDKQRVTVTESARECVNCSMPLGHRCWQSMSCHVTSSTVVVFLSFFTDLACKSYSLTVRPAFVSTKLKDLWNVGMQ